MKPGCVGLKAAALSLILSAQAASAFAADGSKAAAKESSKAVVNPIFISSAGWTQMPAPELSAATFALSEEEMKDLRDSLAETRCKGAPKQADRLESQILDLKARYWALRLKKGIHLEDVRHNLGSMITDPMLKQEFYDRLRKWFVQGDIPELNPHEVSQFVEADQEAFSLHQECGL